MLRANDREEEKLVHFFELRAARGQPSVNKWPKSRFQSCPHKDSALRGGQERVIHHTQLPR